MAPPALTHTLHSRQDAAATGGIVGAIVIVALICLALLSYLGLRRLRARHESPRFIPTQYLKKKYTTWTPNVVKKKRASITVDRRTVQERRTSSPANALQRLSRMGENALGRNHDGTADHRASIRSIMTLPAYSADAREHEQIIGREGERAGIDTVVEYPEDEEEGETRREEEMESLYQIRVRRREERAAREERRRLRREARARNDREALESLREESRRAQNNNAGDSSRDEMTAARMLEEHRNQQRGRRMASVDYAEVGVARHDGSRLRANSAESDRPLLSSAASMSGRNRGLSEPQTLPLPNSSAVTLPPNGHAYHQSNSSLSRFTTNAADISDMEDDVSDAEGGDQRPGTSRGPSAQDSRPGTANNGRGIYNGGNGWSGTRSSIDLANHSLDTLPREHPPGYEESVRGQSSVDVSRHYSDPDVPEIPEPDSNQSSYSRGRRFGLPKGWGGRKQTRDEEMGREMEVRTPTPNQQRSSTAGVQSRPESMQTPLSAAPPYESPTSAGAPQLPNLTLIPSIEITPFTPLSGNGENDERAWPL